MIVVGLIGVVVGWVSALVFVDWFDRRAAKRWLADITRVDRKH